MLVLSRKTGDSIIIDGDVEVIVLAVRGDKVKVGIKAPVEMPIIRSELLPFDGDLPKYVDAEFRKT